MIVPVRVCPVLFAATVKKTVPLPLPILPLLIVIHEELLIGYQLQLVLDAVKEKLPLPPESPIFWVGGAKLKVQLPVCEMV